MSQEQPGISVRTFRLLWKIGFLLILASVSGCAVARFESIPTTGADFDLSREEIQKKFPEVPDYEKKFNWPLASLPSVNNLVDQWGEPTQIKEKWDYLWGLGGGAALATAISGIGPAAFAVGVGLAINPYPAEEYYWVKGLYCIKARVVRVFLHFYRPVVTSWEWGLLNDGRSSTCPEIQPGNGAGGTESSHFIPHRFGVSSPLPLGNLDGAQYGRK